MSQENESTVARQRRITVCKNKLWQTLIQGLSGWIQHPLGMQTGAQASMANAWHKRSS